MRVPNLMETCCPANSRYWYRDYCQLLAITSGHSRHCLEEVMLQHHNKMAKLLEDQRCRDPYPVHPRKNINGSPSTHPRVASSTWMMTWRQTFITHWKPLLTCLYKTRVSCPSKKKPQQSQYNLV